MSAVLDPEKIPVAHGDSESIAGYVEHISPDAVSGWAMTLDGEPLAIELVVYGVHCPCQVEHHERLDVVREHGESARMCGFTLKPLDNTVLLACLDNASRRSVVVLVNGERLRDANVKRTEGGKGNGQYLLGCYVDSVSAGLVKGWAAFADGTGGVVEIGIEGTKIECPVIRLARNDVTDALSVSVAEAGFEILLPGSIWRMKNDKHICHLDIYANGARVNRETVVIGHKELAGWISEYAASRSQKADLVTELLLLEHVQCSGILNQLPLPLHSMVKSLAETHGIEIGLDQPGAEAGQLSQAAEDVASVVLKRAMEELNERFSDKNVSVFENIQSVFNGFNLRGAAREWYLNLAIQLTCSSNEFHRLYEIADLGYLDGFATSRQPHQLALLLPKVVRQHEPERATEILRNIQKNVANSWLPTECLGYAVRELQKMEVLGELDIHDCERFRMAYVAVIEAFKGEWFSRHHDTTLVSVMVTLLEGCRLYTDYHKRELITAAIRLYGLSPAFWREIESRGVAGVSTELMEAEQAWGTIERAIRCKEIPGVDAMRKVYGCLDYFDSKGNSEARNFLRELLLDSPWSKLADAAGVFSVGIRSVIANESSETLRYMSHPSATVEMSSQAMKSCPDSALHTLRYMADYHHSAVYELQCTASHAMSMHARAAEHAGRTSDRQELMKWHEAIVRKAALLGSWQGMFLGADLLYVAYQAELESGVEDVSLLLQAEEIVRKAVSECDIRHILPAPLCALLGRAHAKGGSRSVRGFAQEIRQMVDTKFGGVYERLYHAPASCLPNEASARLDGDVLVVINATGAGSMEDVDTIRQTWLGELVARNVPYLFAVSGEYWTLHDDVLEVYEGRNDVAGNSVVLRLLDWAIKHTSVQYVVVIDASCYMDVSRYFDTLSYRKHHYYGKPVRTNHSMFDRGARHSGQDGDPLPMLDKSPPDTVFAYGGLPVSFSRHAIHSIFDALGTYDGKRLMAVSWHEDKLVGDLLALTGIYPGDEDFDAYVMPDAHDEMASFIARGNGFYPSSNAPCKAVQSGDEIGLKDIHAGCESPGLWPKRIWPTCVKPGLKANCNQLELVSDVRSIDMLLSADVVVVSVVRNEMVMLPQFLSHYRKLGVTCFVFADNCSDDGTKEYLKAQPDVILYAADTEYRLSHYGVSWQQAIVGNHCLGKWVLLADADEFFIYEGCESRSIDEFLASVDAEGDDGVMLYMVDMYPYDGLDNASFSDGNVFEVAPYFDRDALIELRFGGGMYGNSRNFVNGLRHRIAPSRINAYVSQKYALFRYYPWVRFCEGVHYATNMNVAKERGFFAHFKYHSGFKEKVEQEVRRKQHYNGAEEYRKYAGMMAEVAGGFGSPGVSERYVDSSSFAALAKRLG